MCPDLESSVWLGVEGRLQYETLVESDSAENGAGEVTAVF